MLSFVMAPEYIVGSAGTMRKLRVRNDRLSVNEEVNYRPASVGRIPCRLAHAGKVVSAVVLNTPKLSPDRLGPRENYPPSAELDSQLS